MNKTKRTAETILVAFAVFGFASSSFSLYLVYISSPFSLPINLALAFAAGLPFAGLFAWKHWTNTPLGWKNMNGAALVVSLCAIGLGILLLLQANV